MAEKTIKSQSQQRFPNLYYREGIDRMKTCTFCIHCELKSNVFPCSDCLESYKTTRDLPHLQWKE